jgi:hypothetical protein
MAGKRKRRKVKRPKTVERQIKRLKGKRGINPWALAQWQKKKGHRIGRKKKVTS